jgi:uncharacterized protein
MEKQATSKKRIRRLNQRQRKKLRLGEFQELIFLVRIQFQHPLDEIADGVFLSDFIDFIESRKLLIGGMGGTSPQVETDGIIQASRGSPSEDDRYAVVAWLCARSEVATASAGDLVDGWYGWGKL